MNAYQGFVEKLNDFFKSISKEIKTGKVKSHISLEQENDTFRLVQTQEGKRPTVKTWDIPEEDRDDTMTLMKALQEHKENDIFQRLMQAIRSTRNLIHSDKVWKKNIISFMNESYTLDEFVNQLQSGASEVDELIERVKKVPTNQSHSLHEQNIPLQNLYKTLLLRRLNQTKNVKEYDVLKQLLIENQVIHSIRTSDGSIDYQKDGEVLRGTIVNTYESLKEYDYSVTGSIQQRQAQPIGEVISWRQYKLMAQDQGFQIKMGNQKIEEFNSIAVANDSVYGLGQDSGEARKRGQAPMGGRRLRQAASYEFTNQGIPIAFKGILYSNTIKAILSYLYPELRLGGTMEDEHDERVWSLYVAELKAGGDRRKALLQNEHAVLIQKYDLFQSDYEAVKAENVIWMSRFAKQLFVHVHSIFANVMKRSTLVNPYSAQNATAVRRWILRNAPWQQKATQMGLLEEKTTKSIHTLIEVIYGIRLDSVSDSEEDVQMALDDLIDNEIPDWTSLQDIGTSFAQSLEQSGYESPQVSVRELISYVGRYGDSIGSSLGLEPRFRRVSNAVVVGIFLSILHPNLKDFTTTDVEILDRRRPSQDAIKIRVGKEERDILRERMDREGISNFELPVEDDSGDASERKEAREIEDLEYGRTDETKNITIWYGTPTDMRVAFK